MLPCFRHGFFSFLFRSMANDRQMRLRVMRGMMTSSMKPRRPAMNGLANLTRYSSVSSAIRSGIVQLLAEDDLDGTLGSHDGDFRTGPGDVDVAAQVLGRHHVVGSAISLARDQRDLGHRRFGIGVQQLGAVLDDAAVFLRRSRHEAGHVDERQNGNVERVAETNEARRLDRRLDVQAAGQHQRLIGDDADRIPFHASETDDDVLGMLRLQSRRSPCRRQSSGSTPSCRTAWSASPGPACRATVRRDRPGRAWDGEAAATRLLAGR